MHDDPPRGGPVTLPVLGWARLLSYVGVTLLGSALAVYVGTLGFSLWAPLGASSSPVEFDDSLGPVFWLVLVGSLLNFPRFVIGAPQIHAPGLSLREKFAAEWTRFPHVRILCAFLAAGLYGATAIVSWLVGYPASPLLYLRLALLRDVASTVFFLAMMVLMWSFREPRVPSTRRHSAREPGGPALGG